MSALAELTELSSPVRIFHAEPFKFPLKRLDPLTMTAERLQSLWPQLGKFFPSVRPAAFVTELNSGNSALFEIGDWDGVILVSGIVPKMAATVTAFFWGDKRRFISKYGAFAEVRSLVLRYLFTGFKVEKLRCAFPAGFKGAQRFAVRCGFKREAWLRKEIPIDDKLVDLVIFGLLREEV